MFSSRLPSTIASNAIAHAVARARASGESWIDLTETNPTVVGIPYPVDLLRPLADPRGLIYKPESLGLEVARNAVAADYARRNIRIGADRIVLTASTSEAYALLFKLLCDPADEVLVPQPSYPLFDWLTTLEGVRTRPYRLHFDGGAWWIDRRTIEDAVSSRARAVLIVSPNNPTGSILRRDDRDWFADYCARHDLALIVDEVFADYPIAPRADACDVLGAEWDVPVFALGGLSKSAALPQLKLGWIAIAGSDSVVENVRPRLELICDTYLSVSTPVQLAAPALVAAGAPIRAAILARLDANYRQLAAACDSSSPVSLLPAEAGWSAVLRVPAIESEESLVLRLLNEHRVLVHPGFFFDFDSEAFVVVSLLPDPDVFAKGIGQLLGAIQREPV
jgi:aspartate/methionine/tyrosine aminotransferase